MLIGLVALSLTSCATSATAPSASPTTGAPPRTTERPSLTSSPTPAPSALARSRVSDAPLPNAAGAVVVFELAGETRLRAISFGADPSGVLPAQVGPDAIWSQSPDGTRYVIGTTVYDRDGVVLGTIPWHTGQSFTWSTDGRFTCAVVPERPVTGSPLRLETALIGQPARVVARGFGTWSDNAGFPVLSCDASTDRAVVAVFGQGLYAARLWVFRLSTGAIVRSVEYDRGAVARWVAASADGTLLAETEQATASAPLKVTIRSTDDGAVQSTLDDVTVQGFSGNNELLIAAIVGGTAVIDRKTGRRVWSNTSGQYGGFLAEPAGRRLAIGVGFVGGSDQRDVYLVDLDGTAQLLPARAKVSFRY